MQSRAYYYKDQLAIRVELDSHVARRLAGLTLIEKDIRTVKTWIDALQREMRDITAQIDESEMTFLPKDPAASAWIVIVRALFVAIVATYGKLFTSAEGRSGTSLHKSGWVSERFSKLHDDLIHTRNTFAAHSGSDGPERCRVALAIDYTRRNRTPPRIFTELVQPTTVSPPQLKEIGELVEDLQNRVKAKLDKTTEAAYKEVKLTYDQRKLHMLRKGASGRFLKR